MFEKQNTAVVVGPADQALAAEYANKPTVINPALNAEDFAAAAGNRTNRLTIANGATIDLSVKEPARQILLGETDGAKAIVNTELEGMRNRADHLVELMQHTLDPATGQPRPHLIDDHRRLALALHGLQYSAAYQSEVAVHGIRAQENKTRGLEQLQREADEYDRRAADATSREFDRTFGRVRIV